MSMDARRLETLIDDLKPVTRPSLAAYALRIAAALSLAILFVFISSRPRPDIASALLTVSFWAKQALLMVPLIIGAWLSWRLARPTGRLTRRGRWRLGVAGLAVLIGLGALEFLAPVPGGELRAAGFDGLHCLFFASAAAVPMWIIGEGWMRKMAPTDADTAALALGLLAGGVGVSAYALHCPYESAGYILIWYGLAVALVTLVAWRLLPRRLAW